MVNDDNGIRRITFLRISDGDTFVGIMSLARPVRPKPLLEVRIRVEGWNAAELRDAEGPYMRDEFEKILRAAKLITVDMKYMSHDRIVSAVFLDDVLFAGILHERLMAFQSSRGPDDGAS